MNSILVTEKNFCKSSLEFSNWSNLFEQWKIRTILEIKYFFNLLLRLQQMHHILEQWECQLLQKTGMLRSNLKKYSYHQRIERWNWKTIIFFCSNLLYCQFWFGFITELMKDRNLIHQRKTAVPERIYEILMTFSMNVLKHDI